MEEEEGNYESIIRERQRVYYEAPYNRLNKHPQSNVIASQQTENESAQATNNIENQQENSETSKNSSRQLPPVRDKYTLRTSVYQT